MTCQFSSVLSLGLLGLLACKDGIKAEDIPDETATGPVTVDLGGDATRDGGNDGEVSDLVDELWLRVDEVSIHHDVEGWVYIDDGRQNVNLMAQRDGETLRIGSGDVYVGDYDTLRLSVVDAWIVVEGQEYDLAISDGANLDEALDLDVAIPIQASTNAAVWVGWDLDNTLTGDAETWTLGTDVLLSVDVEDQ